MDRRMETLNKALNFKTLDALECLGFIASLSPTNGNGLMFRFGSCEIEVFQPDFAGRVALIGSIEGTSRTIYPPHEFFLPASVISVQQCAALLSYYLRDYPVQESPMWLIEGRSNQDLLPWHIDAAHRKMAYDALPKCFVRREWLRLALKQLEVAITSKPDETYIRLEYANGVLSIMCDEEHLVLSAKGLSWPNAICVRADEFRRDFPKRLRSEEIAFVVGDTHLQIGTKLIRRDVGSGVA